MSALPPALFGGRYVWRHRWTRREIMPTPAAPGPIVNADLWDLIDLEA